VGFVGSCPETQVTAATVVGEEFTGLVATGRGARERWACATLLQMEEYLLGL